MPFFVTYGSSFVAALPNVALTTRITPWSFFSRQAEK